MIRRNKPGLKDGSTIWKGIFAEIKPKIAGIGVKICGTAARTAGIGARTLGTIVKTGAIGGKTGGIAKKMFANLKEIGFKIEAICPAAAGVAGVAKSFAAPG
jgi:hypothetical protein